MIPSAGTALRKWVTTRNVLAVLLTLEAAIIGMVVAGERASRRADQARMAALGTGGLWLDHPAKPVENPPIVEAARAEIRADAMVIGVEIGGKARAYRLGALDDPSGHLVNDMIGGVPLTVAYCNLSQSGRFTRTRRAATPSTSRSWACATTRWSSGSPGRFIFILPACPWSRRRSRRPSRAAC